MEELPVILRGGMVWAGAGEKFARGAVVVGKGGMRNAEFGMRKRERRVLFVGDLSEARRKFGGAVEENWEHCLLMPGMVNAHCHLELGYLRGELEGVRGGELPGECFVRWVKELVSKRETRNTKRETEDELSLDEMVGAAVREGIAESLRFGVTIIGDITRHVEWSRKAAGRGPVRVISFGEVMGIGTQRKMAKSLMMVAIGRAKLEEDFLRFGISPHAPYTVEGPVLTEVMKLARNSNLPVMMHMAELREEKEFLQTLGGPLRELWNVRARAEDVLDEKIPRFAHGPVAWAERWRLLEKRDDRGVKGEGVEGADYDFWVTQLGATLLQLEAGLEVLKNRLSVLNTKEEPLRALQLELEKSKVMAQAENLRARLAEAGRPNEIPILLAHCNYLSDEDVRIIAESGASVVVCPRTRAFFGHTGKGKGERGEGREGGHGRHRFRELMGMGVNVCLGTDSLASNPDLSVLREARALWEEEPGMTAEELMGMVTWRGARALGVEGGELVEGGRGDLVAMRMGEGRNVVEAMGEVIRGEGVPEAVWISGTRG